MAAATLAELESFANLGVYETVKLSRFLPCLRVNLNFGGFLFYAAVLGEDSFSTKLIAKQLL